MITIYLKNFNRELTQKIYDEVIDNLNIYNLMCPKCFACHMSKHAYYSRGVKTKSGKIELVVLRVKCEECNSTHAILLSCIIPYQSIQLKDQIRIIKNINVKQLMKDNTCISELNVYYVRRNYRKYFEQRLISHNISLDRNLVYNCFLKFFRNFNQVKWGCNGFYT